ncbi:hypothetical protein HJC23_008501 [Cyclotella cryptica]|uniref:L domain-like protein n=1 Tax=Cyclotella cryptica TaxID=29204 RepID=A0ABD3R005_9STRA
MLLGWVSHINARSHHSIRGNGALNRLEKSKADADAGLDMTEDVEFWTRMMQVGSIPLVSPKPTGRPTRRPTTPRPTPMPTPKPSPQPSVKPTPLPVTPEPSLISTPLPTLNTVTLAPSPSPSLITPEPSPAPSIVTPAPVSPEPTPAPSLIATPEPTLAPVTPEPSPSPTVLATLEPTLAPVTPEPSPSPTVLTPAPSFPCNLTPEDRALQLRQLYAAFSNDALFDDPTTPQAQALDWITNEDALTICPDDNSCQPLQRYTLAVFYFATNGGAWDQCNAPSDFNDPAAIEAANNNCNRVVTPFAVPNQRVGDTSSDAWLSPSNECEWGGVACWGADTPNLNLCIDQLDFENDGLAGTLVDELGALDSLRFLILEQGDLFGTIPTTYGLLERLLILDLDFNNVQGQLPDEIYGLSSLQQLDLNDNLLTGTISTLIGQLSLLTFFQIDHNEIIGEIPTEMGELEQLRIAFLSDTNLSGTMPAEVCANRNNTNPPGNLGVLVSDCAGNPPPVVCTCCTSCA